MGVFDLSLRNTENNLPEFENEPPDTSFNSNEMHLFKIMWTDVLLSVS